MHHSRTVQCPHCFEAVEIWIDPGEEGRMIRDCDVCCNPWELYIQRTSSGEVRVQVSRAY
jgi:hypothetical protein